MASGRDRYERTAAERRRIRQAQRRAEQRARRRRQALLGGSGVLAVVIVVLIILVAVNTGGSSSKNSLKTASPTHSASVAASGSPTGVHATNTPGKVCTYTPNPQTERVDGPGLPPDRKATGSHTLTLQLTQGTVVATLSPKAPCTVNSFQWLASQQFFTGTHCHRLTTSGIYVLQCGDPTGTGEGGPGYTIPDENLKGATYPAGTIAMANTSAVHTGGSQFFLVYKDTTLPPSYTPFGTITSGLGVVQKIAAAGTADGSSDGAPKQTVTITGFTIS